MMDSGATVVAPTHLAMNFSLQSHIRMASCNKDVVVLDLQKDRFHILPNLPADSVNSALKGDDVSLAEALYQAGFVQPSEQPISITPCWTNGFFEQRWMKPAINIRATWRVKLLATREVCRTNRALKNGTIDNILTELHQLSVTISGRGVNSEDVQRLGSLMAGLNFGFGFDRTGRKCLAYSYTLARMARQAGIPAKLVIGVITKPFFSHAWIEYQNKVINEAL